VRKQILLMVGPTGLPDRVINAMNRQVISHRGAEFSKITKQLDENLKKIFQTKNDVLELTSSGTGAMEAAVQNCFSVGDEVIVAVIGVFSERMAVICETFGLKVTRVVAKLGEIVTPEQVLKAMTSSTKGVFIVHNESATGVRSDIKAFGAAIANTNALLVVDSVSAIGGMDLQMDNWGVDVVFASAQKALMGTPGLALIALSEKAWAAADKSTIPKFYMDLKAARAINKKGQHPWTPAIYSILALHEATNMIVEEGLQNVFARHLKLSNMVIDGMEELGVKLYPKSRDYASITVNTFAMENSPEFVNKLEEQYGIIVGGGQGELYDTTFRVGTMGYVSENDIVAFLHAAKEILKK